MVFSGSAILRLRPALVAHHGVEMANDLCADAIAYAGKNRDRVRDLDNPVGYLYRVPQVGAAVPPLATPGVAPGRVGRGGT